jgi:hypothetical protein
MRRSERAMVYKRGDLRAGLRLSTRHDVRRGPYQPARLFSFSAGIRF